MGLLIVSLVACAVDEDGPAAPGLGGEDCVARTPAAGVYAGPLYDTHAHADLSSAPAALDCLADRHNLRTLVLFAGQTGGDNAGNRVHNWMSPYAPRFLPFVHLDPKSVSDVSVTELDRALARTPQIRGVGELALYRPPWQANHLSDPPWASLFQWAAQKNMWLMIHPRSDQIDELETILAAYPNTKVLVHTAWNASDMPRLLQTYANIYFTIDAATLISVEQPSGSVDVLMSPVTGGKDEFIQRYDVERDAILLDSYQRWSPTMLAAPDRVMWGTDTFAAWHYDPAVYDRIMDFARRWTAMLPAELREAYAYRNAERLLGSGPQF